MVSRLKPTSKSPPTKELQFLLYGTCKEHTVTFQVSKEKLLTMARFAFKREKRVFEAKEASIFPLDVAKICVKV